MNRIGRILTAILAGALLVFVCAGLLLPIHSSVSDSDEIAAQYGVSIIWTNLTCKVVDPEAEGCFSPLTPTVIYVSPDLPSWAERHAVLHEIAHVLQFRQGERQDECAADRFAQAHGSDAYSYCAEPAPKRGIGRH
jgi:hypothetical protein